MKTYTKYKLTDAQLIRLSQMANGRPHKSGNALYALEAKGLVREREFSGGYGHSHSITAEGLQAFQQARGEGW
jgi:hypothetical protein